MRFVALIKYKSIDNIDEEETEIHEFSSKDDRAKFIMENIKYSKDILLSEIKE